MRRTRPCQSSPNARLSSAPACPLRQACISGIMAGSAGTTERSRSAIRLAPVSQRVTCKQLCPPSPKRSKLRRELFHQQDVIDAERNDLIAQLESQLQQQVQEQILFTSEWELV